MCPALSRPTGTTEADSPIAGIDTRTGGLVRAALDNLFGGSYRSLVDASALPGEGSEPPDGTR